VIPHITLVCDVETVNNSRSSWIGLYLLHSSCFMDTVYWGGVCVSVSVLYGYTLVCGCVAAVLLDW
jgi:hypothetical protein